MFTAPTIRVELMRFINERRFNRRLVPFTSNVSYHQFKRVFNDRHIARLLNAPASTNISTILLYGFSPEQTSHIVMMNRLHKFTYFATESKDIEIFFRTNLLQQTHNFTIHVGSPDVLPFKERFFDAVITGDPQLYLRNYDQLTACSADSAPCLSLVDGDENLKEIHSVILPIQHHVKVKRSKHEILPDHIIDITQKYEWKTEITFADIQSYLAFLFSLPMFDSLSLEEHFEHTYETLSGLYEGKDTITVTVHFHADEFLLS